MFAGDEDAPKVIEAVKVWISLGIKEEIIFYLGKNIIGGDGRTDRTLWS